MEEINFDVLGNDENLDIFDEVPETPRNFVKFVNIGDSVQGTYVARNDNSIDGYGNAQTLVVLKKKDGEMVTVSVRHNKIGLLKEVDQAKLGEIVGFKLTGIKENVGKQPTKFIRFVHDPKIVDQEWLDGQKKGVEPKLNTPVNVLNQTAPTASTNDDKITKIAKFAKENLGATDDVSIKEKVMEATGLAFIKINMDLIIERLGIK